MAANGRINVKEAVRIAVEYVRELYAADQLADLRLEEEVELSEDGKHWFVTLGFSRPELAKQQRQAEPPAASVLSLLRPKAMEREYKVVKINARSGDVQSMKIRQV